MGSSDWKGVVRPCGQYSCVAGALERTPASRPRDSVWWWGVAKRWLQLPQARGLDDTGCAVGQGRRFSAGGSFERSESVALGDCCAGKFERVGPRPCAQRRASRACDRTGFRARRRGGLPHNLAHARVVCRDEWWATPLAKVNKG